MTSPTSAWQYSPRPALATIAVFGAWGASAVPLLLLFFGLILAGPWDPDDLTPDMWRAQAVEYAGTRATALVMLIPFASLALIASVGGVLRRWSAPLLYAGGMWIAIGVLTLLATVGLENQINAALEAAAAPPPVVTTPEVEPPPPSFTSAEVNAALRERIDVSLGAVEGTPRFVDGRPITGPDDVPVDVTTCETGGSAVSVLFEFRTDDDIASEESILSAWAVDGFIRDRAAGTNLLYGAEESPILRAALRGDPAGYPRMTIESRCAQP